MLNIILGSFFFIGLALLCFAYCAFPLFLSWLNRIQHLWRGLPTSHHIMAFAPSVQVIIACFNEDDRIRKSLANILKQSSLPGKLSILVISDGSTDATAAEVGKLSKENQSIRLFSLPANVGKNQAINAAFSAGEFKDDLLCFTDADSEFEVGALASVVAQFADPKVGLVGGCSAYWLSDGSAQKAEGFFWRLENFLRESEGNLGVLVSCTGLLIMMRRELFEPLPTDVNTDFAMPLSVLAQGYETRFDKNAVVRSSFPAEEETVLKRRKRTIIRALTTIATYRHRLSWKVRLVLFWHKMARYYLLPVQGAVLFANLVLVNTSPSPLWVALFLVQSIFYGAAIVGWLAERLNIKMPLVYLPYQFTRQHAIALIAVVAFCRGQRVSKWIPPR